MLKIYIKYAFFRGLHLKGEHDSQSTAGSGKGRYSASVDGYGILDDGKALAVIQCIKYEKLNDKSSTDIFTENMLRGKLGINAIESTKSLYDLVVLDSMGTEKNFAESLEHEDDVVVYTKLPNGFYINTPMGTYNPDWAVAFREGSVKHVYFVAESKGNDLQVHYSEALRKVKLNVPVATSRPSATTATSTTLPRTTSHYMIL